MTPMTELQMLELTDPHYQMNKTMESNRLHIKVNTYLQKNVLNTASHSKIFVSEMLRVFR